MNNIEMRYYNTVFEEMMDHKNKHLYMYKDKDAIFLRKHEFKVGNNSTKGVIMFEVRNKFLVDIFASNGRNIITGLLNLKFNNYNEAIKLYEEESKMIKKLNIISILEKGRKNFKID